MKPISFEIKKTPLLGIEFFEFSFSNGDKEALYPMTRKDHLDRCIDLINEVRLCSPKSS